MRITKNKRTLKQVVLVSVGALLLVLLAGSAVLHFVSAKSYLEQQLARHSQDAATFLGLALSSASGAESLVMQERMIDSIFDSGDYEAIEYLDTSNEVVVSRQLERVESDAPAWFLGSLVNVSYSGQAKIMSGWTQRGLVIVSANSALAGNKLWALFTSQLVLFVVAFVFGLLSLYIVLRKLMRPLFQMEVQARDVAARSFEGRIGVPATRELAVVAQAMNEMSESLQQVFDEQLKDIERLRDMSRKDPVTLLFNREGFDARLKSDLTENSVSGTGVLVLVMLNDFGGVNLEFGREKADGLLKDIAKELIGLQQGLRGAYSARRSGAQFSVFLPGVSADEGEGFARALMLKVSAIPLLRQALRDDWLHIGLAEINEAETVSSLLSKADLALRQAQSEAVSAWQRFVAQHNEGVSEDVRQANHWQAILQDVLANNKVILHEQPVEDLKANKITHKQILSRIEVEGKLVVAATFLPMAKRFGLMVLFDEMIVETALKKLAQSEGDDRYSITLSEAAIADEMFMQWLSSHLAENKHVLHRVTFEVPEHALGFGEDVLSKLCALAEQWGFGISIDRFGVSSVPFSYLQRVSIEAIKIDSSFVRDIHLNQDSQFFLRAAVQLAHSQGIKVIAIGVEKTEELEFLHEMGVDAAMGYIIQRPALAAF